MLCEAGAFYLRLVGRPLEVYQYLEPLYNDYRKLRLRESDGSFALTHMDEVVDQLLNNEYLFDIALPRIPNRSELCYWQAVIEAATPVTHTQLLTLRQRTMLGQCVLSKPKPYLS